MRARVVTATLLLEVLVLIFSIRGTEEPTTILQFGFTSFDERFCIFLTEPLGSAGVFTLAHLGCGRRNCVTFVDFLVKSMCGVYEVFQFLSLNLTFSTFNAF